MVKGVRVFASRHASPKVADCRSRAIGGHFVAVTGDSVKDAPVLRAGNEVFETSGGHLSRVSGQGWVNSRKLETGMVLHTAAGPARGTQVSESGARPTYKPDQRRLQYVHCRQTASVVA